MKKVAARYLINSARYSGTFLGRLARILPSGIKLKMSELLGKCYVLPNKMYCLIYCFGYDFLKRMYFAYRHPVTLERNITFCDCTMRLDVTKKTQRTLYLSKVYEPPITKYISSNLKKGDVFVDIGANVGYYTLIGAKLAGNSGRVVAFEPEMQNFASLVSNIEINNLRNVICIRKAVSDSSGVQHLFINPLNEGGHRLRKFEKYSDGREKWTLEKVKICFPHVVLRQQVETITFDEFISSLSEQS